MLMILARLGRSESFWAVVKVRSPHTGPEVCYIIQLVLAVARLPPILVSSAMAAHRKRAGGGRPGRAEHTTQSSATLGFWHEERPREIPAFSQVSRASKKSPHLLGLESQLAAAVAGRMPAGRSRCRAHPARLASPPPRRRAARAPSQRLPSPGWRRERPREGSPRAGARDAGTTKVLATAPRPPHHMRRLL